MKKRIISAVLASTMLLSVATSCQQKNAIKTTGHATISSLTVDYLQNPVGIDSETPLFGWNMRDSARGQRQTAYQIMVSDSYNALMIGDYNVWDSGKIESDESVAIPYAGKKLTPSTRYYWQVQIWDKDGKNCLSRDEAYFETGLMADGFSDASWILQTKSGGLQGGAPIMRKQFKLDKGRGQIESARVYATCAGLYEIYLNGDKLGDDFLNPGNTQYDKRILYQTYDVTKLLKSGENTMSAQLGKGWWSGWAGLIYLKEYPAFISKTVIKYKDGSVQTIVTDGSWEFTVNGPITKNDIYNGETYVASRTEKEYEYEPVAVKTAEELGIGEITSQLCGTIKCMQKVEPVNVTEPEEGTYIYDFGQNLAGVVEITVKAERGTNVVIRHGEVLNNGETNADGAVGTLYTANLRGAQATDKYVCLGNGKETWHPVFTFHGFRYAEITGIDKENIISVKALVLYTEMADAASLVTSDGKINQLESNTYWGMRSNFLSVPTDCPQRDERFGYLGDAQVFAGTSMYLMDTAAFYNNKFIMDILDCFQDIGTFPNSAPGTYTDHETGAQGGWADGGIIIPYTAYVRYGDITMLEECYPAMQKHIEFMKNEAGNDYIRDNNPQYGDWLNINESTPVGVCDTAYCVYTTSMMVDVARWLGKDEDSQMYADLCQKYKDAWVKTYMNSDGSTKCNTQASYVFALYFDIVPEDLRDECAAKLVDRIRSNGNTLTVGFLSVRYLLPTLCDNGYTDVAFELLMQDKFPSWLYMVDMGATTIWERWDGIVNNTFQYTGMNSFNHFAFGCVTEWMYSYMAGIQSDPEAPGFKHFILQPTYGGSITSADGEYDSIYGIIKSKWTLEGSTFNYECTVPANTTATLYLPTSAASSVTESGKTLDSAEGITLVGEEDGRVIIELQSGSYSFVSTVS